MSMQGRRGTLDRGCRRLVVAVPESEGELRGVPGVEECYRFEVRSLKERAQERKATAAMW